MKSFLRIFIAFLFIALGIGFVFVFEFYAKEKIDTVEVIIATETIDFKELITEDKIKVVNIRRSMAVGNRVSVTAYKSLLGKYASVKIEKGTQLYPELVDTYDLVPNANKGEFVAPIPKEWLFAVPGSLRSSYVADIYIIGDKEQAVMQSLLNSAKEQGKAEKDEVVETNVTPTSTEAILKNVRVASVKDSNNQEVTKSVDTQQATGQVAELEIIANDEMFETIKRYTESGYRLYVVYKFERGQETSIEESNTDEAK